MLWNIFKIKYEFYLESKYFVLTEVDRIFSLQ